MLLFFRRVRPYLTALALAALAWLGPGEGTLVSLAQAQAPAPAQPQGQGQGDMRFKVEVSSPPSAQVPPPPFQPPNLAAPPVAPPINPGAVNSPLPPEPPKLGRPEESTVAPVEEPKTPLTPAEVKALQTKEALLGDLAGWRDSVEQGYEFKAGSFSDPFMPIESVARPPSKTKGTEQENEVKPIIQQLALNQFTLTAIVIKADRRQSIAMVDSGGKGYMIHEGTLIGNNNGFVREITPDKVIIEEPDTFRAAGNPRVTEFRLNSIQDTGGLEIFKSE